MVHKKRERQNVWSTIIIKPSGPYICSEPWIDKLPGGNLTSFWTFYEPGFYRICRFCKSFFKLDEAGETYPQSYLQSSLTIIKAARTPVAGLLFYMGLATDLLLHMNLSIFFPYWLYVYAQPFGLWQTFKCLIHTYIFQPGCSSLFFYFCTISPLPFCDLWALLSWNLFSAIT